MVRISLNVYVLFSPEVQVQVQVSQSLLKHSEENSVIVICCGLSDANASSVQSEQRCISHTTTRSWQYISPCFFWLTTHSLT
jgi:hypothetical protein